MATDPALICKSYSFWARRSLSAICSRSLSKSTCGCQLISPALGPPTCNSFDTSLLGCISGIGSDGLTSQWLGRVRLLPSLPCSDTVLWSIVWSPLLTLGDLLLLSFFCCLSSLCPVHDRKLCPAPSPNRPSILSHSSSKPLLESDTCNWESLSLCLDQLHFQKRD